MKSARTACAADAPKVDSGDTALVLASSALVMIITPALGLFYGGMVMKKNALSTIMFSFVVIALISVQWVLYGYSQSFGPCVGHVIGNLDWLGQRCGSGGQIKSLIYSFLIF